MKKFRDSKLVRCRWVLANKGDSQSPDVRARLVACEVNHNNTKEESYFASTPPLEAKRMLFAKFADQPVKEGIQQRLSFVDVRKAYFNGIPRRNLFMSLPRELGLPGHWVGRQIRCVYGTRDAGAIWEDTYRECLESSGFASGKASPCVFYNAEHDISTVVHGDDFTSLGSDAALTWMETQMAKSFELQLRGRLGIGCEGELRILNRIVRVNSTGLEYEADPRHVELITESLELADCKPVCSPGVKNPSPELEPFKNEEGCTALGDEGPKAEQNGDGTMGPKAEQHDSGEVCNLMDFYCAVTATDIDTTAKKKVTFNEANIPYQSVCAYSTVYGFLPCAFVPTAHG